MQTLSALFHTIEPDATGLTAKVDAVWLQGRSTFGGVQAALAVEAMLPLSDGLPIRTIQATLCAPIAVGRIRIEAQLLRQGGNTRQIEARIVAGGDTLALFVGIFGRARESVVMRSFEMPSLDAAKGVRMPFIQGLSPAFTQHFEASLLQGHFPSAGKPDSRHIYRIGLNDDSAVTQLRHVLAFADFPPPIGLSWLREFKLASTMTWMLNFTGHEYAGQGLSDWLIEVNLDSAREGYTQQTLTLFAPDGHAVARGTQCMVVFG